MTAAVNYIEPIHHPEDLWTFGETSGFHNGYDAWREIRKGIDASGPLSDEQKVELQKRAAYALQHLDADGYVAFCQRVEEYRRDHPASDIFPDFPRFETARERYPAALKSLDKKLDLLDKYKTPTILLTGALAFVGGAIGVGNLADSGIDNAYLNHIVTAAGSLVAGILGSGAAGVSYLVTDSWLGDQKRKIGEKTKEDLVAKVRSYLANHQ